MKDEIDFKYQKCGFCRYFLPWGNYEEGASAADVERGRCRRYPPKVDLKYYPYFSKHFMHFMEDLAQFEHSGDHWYDPETKPDEVLQTCSILPYVQMDDFCGEFKPAYVIQLKEIVDLFEPYNISTDKFQQAIGYFEKLSHRKSKKWRP